MSLFLDLYSVYLYLYLIPVHFSAKHTLGMLLFNYLFFLFDFVLFLHNQNFIFILWKVAPVLCKSLAEHYSLSCDIIYVWSDFMRTALLESTRLPHNEKCCYFSSWLLQVTSLCTIIPGYIKKKHHLQNSIAWAALNSWLNWRCCALRNAFVYIIIRIWILE